MFIVKGEKQHGIWKERGLGEEKGRAVQDCQLQRRAALVQRRSGPRDGRELFGRRTGHARRRRDRHGGCSGQAYRDTGFRVG